MKLLNQARKFDPKSRYLSLMTRLKQTIKDWQHGHMHHNVVQKTDSIKKYFSTFLSGMKDTADIIKLPAHKRGRLWAAIKNFAGDVCTALKIIIGGIQCGDSATCLTAQELFEDGNDITFRSVPHKYEDQDWFTHLVIHEHHSGSLYCKHRNGIDDHFHLPMLIFKPGVTFSTIMVKLLAIQFGIFQVSANLRSL